MTVEEKVAATFLVIMVYNRKGGVGKTTISGNLAAFLAALGFHVAIIDGDDQENVTKLDTRNTGPASLTNVIMETQMGRTKHPPVPLRDAMVQIRKRLWLVPADKNLVLADDYIAKHNDPEIFVDRIADLRAQLLAPPPWEHRFSWLHEPKVTISAFQLEPTTDEEYLTAPEFLDFVFWDSPPADNHLTNAMMYSADKILVPVEMDQFSADGLMKVLDGIKNRFRNRTHKAEIVGVLPNKIIHQPSDVLTMDFLESVFRHFPSYARRPVHFDLQVKNAWAYGLTALEQARDSRGTRELCSLALDLVGYTGDMAGVSYCETCAAAVERAMEPVSVSSEEV